MRDICCLTLLHQSQETRLKSQRDKLKLLDQLKFFTSLTIQALKAFYIDNNFTLLDPHIGESLCQIRAYQFITSLKESNKNNTKESARQKIDELCNHINYIDKAIAQIQNMADCLSAKEPSSIIKFVNEMNLLYFIDEEMLVIAISFFLTKFKYATANRNFYIDYKQISLTTNTSIKYAKKITHYYQKLISANSCQFIENISQELVQPNESSILIKYLKHFDDDYRSVLPCHLVTKIILLHMCKKRIPAILTIRRYSQLTPIDSISLYFESNPIHNFILVKVPKIMNNDNQIAMHIDGIINYNDLNFESSKKFIERLQTIGLMDLILANMAAHPQYPGTKLNEFSSNPYSIEPNFNARLISNSDKLSLRKLEIEFLKMKNLGEKIGCTLENPSLFLIEHISCVMINEILCKNNQVVFLESIEA